MANPQVAALDYNAIREKVSSILGSGLGSKGYGQTVTSSAVSVGEIISKGEWDALKSDIVSIILHQNGVPPTIVNLSSGAIIEKGPTHPNTNYNSLIEQAILNRFNIGDGNSIVTAATSQTRTGSWSVRAECVLTVTFANSNDARYFFNSSGKIRITSTRTGGASTPQNSSWTSLLSTASTQVFEGGGTQLATFYTLNQYQEGNFTDDYNEGYTTVYQLGATSNYSDNNYLIEATCNCSASTNALGTADTVKIRVSWNDTYVDPDTLNPDYPNPATITAPDDTVDGTLSVVFEEFKAIGELSPSGTFTITSPSYSVSSITTS